MVRELQSQETELNSRIPEPLDKKFGSIRKERIRTGLLLMMLAMVTPGAYLNAQPAQSEAPLEQNESKESANGWWYVRPELQIGLGLGSDAGGLRLEYRDQNRVRLLAYPGLNLAVRHPDQPWLHAGVHASARLLQDYHYYNSNTDDADGEVRTGEAYAYFNWRTDDWWSSRTTALWSGEGQTDGIHLRVGRLAADIDPEGLRGSTNRATDGANVPRRRYRIAIRAGWSATGARVSPSKGIRIIIQSCRIIFIHGRSVRYECSALHFI
ncbi:MAG: hypothetical protein KDK27_00985 [Leptospiraceae bacterium]|nr:hypothetical protein [Leptospiraceae bacterium]